MVSGRFNISSSFFFISLQSKLMLKSCAGSIPIFILGISILKNNLVFFTHSCHFVDDALISSRANFSRNCSDEFTVKRSIIAIRIFLFFLTRSSIVFSTSEDFPHRLGEIREVLIPLVRLSDSFFISSVLLMNASSVTVVPKMKGDVIISQIFYTIMYYTKWYYTQMYKILIKFETFSLSPAVRKYLSSTLNLR